MSGLGDNSLPMLATAIAAAHKAHRASAIESAAHAIEAGRLLIEAKSVVAHGEWAPWLLAHASVSERTARRYMQLARSGIKPATVADFGLRATVEALARGSGDLPKPRDGDELLVFETDAKSFTQAFCVIREEQPGYFGFLGLSWFGSFGIRRPVAWRAIQDFIAYASDSVLTPTRWRWQVEPPGEFELLRTALAEGGEPLFPSRPAGEIRDTVLQGQRYREVETLDPGFIRRALDAMVSAGEEPTREALTEAVSQRLGGEGSR